MQSKIVLIIIGVIVPLLLITFLHISIYIKPNATDINRTNEADNGFATEDMNTDEMAIETELLYQDILELGDNELLIDSRLPNGSVNMIIEHFRSMDNGDINSFKSTLAPEDGGDSNTEPNTLKTFVKYSNTGVYIKEIGLFNDDLPKSDVLDEADFSQIIKVVVRNPTENEDETYWLVVTNVRV